MEGKRKNNTTNQCIEGWSVDVREFVVKLFMRYIYEEATIVRSRRLIALLWEVLHRSGDLHWQ